MHGKAPSDDDESKSCHSVYSANADRPYKPRPRTLAAYLLIALKVLAQSAYINQSSLKNYLKSENSQSFSAKPFSLAVANLAKAGYV